MIICFRYPSQTIFANSQIDMLRKLFGTDLAVAGEKISFSVELCRVKKTVENTV